MLVSRHVIFTGIFALILYPYIGFYSLIVFLSGFVFDIDHYFYYAVRKKDISLINAYSYSLERTKSGKKERDVFHSFHTVEFWILLIILSFWIHKIFLFVFIGLIFHMFFDWIAMWKEQCFGGRAWSILGWISRN